MCKCPEVGACLVTDGDGRGLCGCSTYRGREVASAALAVGTGSRALGGHIMDSQLFPDCDGRHWGV